MRGGRLGQKGDFLFAFSYAEVYNYIMNSLIDKLKYYRYRFLWNVAPLRRCPQPIHLDLELANHCTLKCPMCYHSQNPLPFTKGYMPTAKAFAILQAAANFGFKSVKLNWRGEALLHKDYAEIIKFASGSGFSDIMVNTCAVGVPEKNLRAAAKYATDLRISHDEYHAAGALTWEQARERVRWMIRYYRPKHMRPIIIQRRDDVPQQDFMQEGYRVITAPPLKRGVEGVGIDVSKAKRKYCGQPSRRIVISWQGLVFGCCVAYSQPLELMYGDWTDAFVRDGMADKRANLIKNLKRGDLPHPCKSCTSRDAYKL